MATLQRLRNNAGILVASVIGLALVAFIMGDLMETGGDNLFRGNQFEVANIAGESINIQEFEHRVRRYENYYQQNTGEMIDDEIRNAIREQVWRTMVQEFIMQHEASKTGLRVESAEIFELIQGQRPHQLVLQSPYFHDPETRRFDKTRLMTFLRNLENYDPEIKEYWFFIEDNILQDRMFTKYMNLVNKAQYATTLEAKRRHKENNTRFDFEFIHADFNTIEDEQIDIADRDIRRFYNTYKNRYKQDASRDIHYAYFDIMPSEADRLATYEWIVGVTEEFRTTENPVQYINMQSDTVYKGANYAPGDLPEELDAFAFTANIGDVYGPYEVNGTFKAARLLDIKQLPDSIRARHILFQPSQEMSRQDVEMMADSIFNQIISGTASFAEMAFEHGTDGTAEEGGDLGWFTEGMMVQPFSDSCFYGEVGRPMLVQTQFGLHIVEVTDMSRKTEKRQVGIIKREVLPSSETYQGLFAEANRFAGQNRSIEALQDASQAQGISLSTQKNLPESANGIPSIAPTAREIIKWVYEAKEGEVSSTFEAHEKFIIVAVDKVREKGFAPLVDVRESIVEELIKKEKAALLTAKFNESKDNGGELSSIAGKMDKELKQAFNVNYAAHSVTGVGTDPKLPAAVSALSPNTVSPPFTGRRGVYMAEVISLDEAGDLPDYTIQKMTIKNERSSRAHMQVMETLKEELGVEDSRTRFY